MKLLLGLQGVVCAGAVSVYGAAQAPADTSSAAAALAVVHHASLPNTLHQHGGGPRGRKQKNGQAAVSKEDSCPHPHHLHTKHAHCQRPEQQGASKGEGGGGEGDVFQPAEAFSEQQGGVAGEEEQQRAVHQPGKQKGGGAGCLRTAW